jgi:hypothetical protein
VHWLRVLIDEGHSLGASLGLTNKLAMAVQLSAARRWVMTGTPTPATAAGGCDMIDEATELEHVVLSCRTGG